MFTLQRLQPRHAALYRQLMLDAYELHPQAFTSSAEERASLPLSWWETRLAEDEDSAEVVFAAVDQEHILGVVGLTFSSRSKARHKVHLFGMYVAQPHQGQGVGRALMKTALNYASDRPHAQLMQLTVSEDNPAALRLYAEFGFEPFGREPCAVLLNGRFIAKIHLWRMLSGALFSDQATAAPSA